MGFERFFFGKEKVEEAGASPDVDELDEKGKSRRGFLVGAAALAAASAIPMQEAFGQSDTVEPIVTPEDKERNVERIRAYESHIKSSQEELARLGITKHEVMEIFYGDGGVPPTDRRSLEGTELDREAFFRMRGSWPAVQLRKELGQDLLQLRFAHNVNDETKVLLRQGNGFFVDEAFISNKHQLNEVIPCENISENDDVAGCGVDDLGLREALGRHVEKVGLTWDRAKAQEDIHGKLIHMPSLHEKKGASEADNAAITSGVLFKITPSLLFDPQNPRVRTLFSEKHLHLREQLLRSYACIVPSEDVNGDGRENEMDVRGISGSPVFTDEDCASKKQVPSGIEWGALTINDTQRGLSYTVVLVHGPEVVGEMIDTVNTLLSMDLDETEVSNEIKFALSTKVQQALVDYGYRNLGVDGVYGEDTKAVVQAFQERVFDEETRNASIIPGVIDRRTWNALFPNEQNPDKRALWGLT
jgi:hypothetical protein